MLEETGLAERRKSTPEYSIVYDCNDSVLFLFTLFHLARFINDISLLMEYIIVFRRLWIKSTIISLRHLAYNYSNNYHQGLLYVFIKSKSIMV